MMVTITVVTNLYIYLTQTLKNTKTRNPYNPNEFVSCKTRISHNHNKTTLKTKINVYLPKKKMMSFIYILSMIK